MYILKNNRTDMLNFLFPIPVYKGQNTGLIDVCQTIFNKCPEYGFDDGLGFKTTLIEYSPYSAKVNWEARSLEEAEPLLGFIKQSAIEYLKETAIDEEKYEVIVNNLWLNEYGNQGSLIPHTHYGYSFSGTYYVECPGDSGKINFHNFTEDWFFQKLQHMKEFTPANSTSWWLPVTAGDIVIFPSYLKHSVPPTEHEGSRKSISFDVLVHPK